MKCFFGVVAGWIFSLTVLRADPASDLFSQGNAAFNGNDFKTATQDFDQILANYPSTPLIHTVRIQDGLAYLRLGDYDKTVSVLSAEIAKGSSLQGTAFFYTGMAQLEMGSKLSGAAANDAFAKAADTMTQLITTIASAPTDENKDYHEDALYNRALAYFYQDKLPQAEADVQQLLQPPFNNSLSRPDYQLLLGNLYAREASEALAAKKPDDAVRGLATQAEQAFDQAIADPNALIQANQARLAKAQVLYLTASLDLPSLDGYQKALDVYHDVRRKADLLQIQQDHLQTLIAKNQAQLQNAPGGSNVATENSRLIERETGRLKDLTDGPDPVVQALIGIAQCYNSMKEGDEARTVLHRLAHATLTDDEQSEVDFALIYSYVLGGETAQADQALTAYLAKHPNDPQAQGLSVQMASDLIKRKDYAGALAQAQRSLKDFPTGQNAGDAVELEAEALQGLGKLDAAKKVEDDYVTQHPDSPIATNLLLTRAQNETAQGDTASALVDFQKVRDNTSASTELRANADVGYINTLQALGRNDEVVRESQAFASQYANSPFLPNVLVMGAIGLDKSNQTDAAVAAFQDVARKFPDNTDIAPIALFYVVNIYQRANNVPAMIQAANDLAKAFPKSYALLMQAADAVSDAYVKQRKFDLAIGEYQPLTDATDPAVAASAQNKIGELWIKAAKSMGAYQSMQDPAQRAEGEKRLAAAEAAFVDVLKNHADQLDAVDGAFQGLDHLLLQRRSWGLLKEPDYESYLGKATADLTDPGMQTRVELAKAGLPFIDKDGAKQYPAALARFRAATSANPSLPLTRTEANRYGELLLAAKDYPTAQQVYQQLLQSSSDPYTQADGLYGLGAASLAQGDLTQAAGYFQKMKALPGGAGWNKHILDANFGLALAAEQAGQADAAKQTYASLMRSPDASVELQAKAMLGYGRILAQEGATLKPAVAGTMESAVSYFQQVDTIFGPAVPELSAEGLYDAAQLYEKGGDSADAQKMYQSILKNYATSAPDWAAKAQGH